MQVGLRITYLRGMNFFKLVSPQKLFNVNAKANLHFTQFIRGIASNKIQ
jgi:hypothetical protein